MSATRNAEASSSTSEQPLANQDTAHLFDPLLTRYASKAEFIDTNSTKSAQQGFRLWVGEGRNLMDPEGAAAGRVELTCYKFKVKDANGKKTRVGGCRFSMKAVTVYDREVEPAQREWRFVAGLFMHNHDCGPPLSEPKKFGIRPARVLPPAKKAKKGKTTMPTPETSQSPPEEDQLAEEESDYPTDVETTAPFSVECALDGDGDIPIFEEVDELEEGAAQRRSRTNSAILDEASLVSAILYPLPVGQFSGDDNVPTNFLAFDFSSPLRPSQHPLDHPTLLSLHTPPIDHPFRFFRAHTSNLSIEEFLRSEGKDLEQYSSGFAVAGYDDSDSLLLPSDAVISQFLASDLLALCPSLFANPSHQQLLSSLVIAHRSQRITPYFQNDDDEVLGRLFHDTDLAILPPPTNDIPVEVGLGRGTKRPFDAVLDGLSDSNSLGFH